MSNNAEITRLLQKVYRYYFHDCLSFDKIERKSFRILDIDICTNLKGEGCIMYFMNMHELINAL